MHARRAALRRVSRRATCKPSASGDERRGSSGSGDFYSTGRLPRSVTLTLAERLDRLDGLMDVSARIAPLSAAACPGAHGPRWV